MTHSAWNYRRRLPVPFSFGLGYASILLAILLALSAVAGDFRVDTVVYRIDAHAGDEKAESIGRNTTYFTNALICDVSEPVGAARTDPPPTVLLVDRAAQTATILDGEKQVACVVSSDEVFRTVAAIISIASRESTGVEGNSERFRMNSPLVRFAAAPTFAVSWNSADDEVKLFAKPMRYTVETLPMDGTFDARVVADYREMADWSARINATRADGLPPNARLELNDVLARKSRLPKRVEVHRAGDHATYFSTHTYHWQLTAADRQGMDVWKEKVAKLAAVDLVTLRVGDRNNPSQPRQEGQ